MRNAKLQRPLLPFPKEMPSSGPSVFFARSFACTRADLHCFAMLISASTKCSHMVLKNCEQYSNLTLHSLISILSSDVSRRGAGLHAGDELTGVAIETAFGGWLFRPNQPLNRLSRSKNCNEFFTNSLAYNSYKYIFIIAFERLHAAIFRSTQFVDSPMQEAVAEHGAICHARKHQVTRRPTSPIAGHSSGCLFELSRKVYMGFIWIAKH